MELLRRYQHPNIKNLADHTMFCRLSTRAITLKGNEILLLYTQRYSDYSLPGGGIDAGEDQVTGMTRELMEETGAKNITNIKPYGIYEEYRPWYKPEFDIVHMISYCYTCNIDRQLGETSYEEYEIQNGMKPVWIDIHQAISHNEDVMRNSQKKGLSIEREIFLLKHITNKLFTK